MRRNRLVIERCLQAQVSAKKSEAEVVEIALTALRASNERLIAFLKAISGRLAVN